MSIDATYAKSFSAAGMSFASNATVSSDLATPWSVTLAAAKAGSLTTRTDNDTGTLTMATGHGITTGQRLDVYWFNSDGTIAGRRYGMTVGTVSGDSVPIDGGGGDNLPVAATAITAMVPDEETIALTGNNAMAIVAKCPIGGTVVFATSGNATILAITLTAANTVYIWASGEATNPFAGQTVAKVFLSHGSSSVSSTLTGLVQYN